MPAGLKLGLAGKLPLGLPSLSNGKRPPVLRRAFSIELRNLNVRNSRQAAGGRALA